MINKMILKLIGSSLIIFSSLLIGYSKTLKLREQLRIINLFINFFSFARADILTTRLTLFEILNRFKSKVFSAHTTILEYYYKQNGKPLLDVKNVYQIDENVHKVILNLFNSIGYSSISEIDRIIDEGVRELREYYEIHKEKYSKNSKMFTLLGLFCGVSICILLL
ncbi:hypothetical protein Csac_2133 [Caldicellulosiruptor saccharolyticus DSM 8903]|uniref:Sporulation stage III, protein AB n=2 Tax=Caldicellulosiruptor saccharolyticus TaxID=44001 RepID=A4XLD1_CALS8|nr:hypothetical protein Csac_2133 [Caldicellulosiruptor saccharolyticus DSM 8903]